MPKFALLFAREVVGSYDISKDEILVGRSPNADIVIDNPSVSREHARIRKQDNAYVIEDMETVNGVFVNGQRIKSCTLKPGDEIHIGKHTLVFDKEMATTVGGQRAQPQAWPEGTVFVDPNEMAQIQRKMTAQRASHLRNMDPRAKGKIISLEKTEMLIGKGAHCDVIVTGFFVGAEHVKIKKEGDQFRLISHSSWFPAKVNGQKAMNQILANGDTIQVANTRLQFFDKAKTD